MTAFFDSHPLLRWTLSALFVATALYTAARILVGLAASRGRERATGFYTDRDSDYAHLIMSTAMLAMLTTTGIPHLAWRILFATMAIGYAALLLLQIPHHRTGTGLTTRVGVLGYHLLAALAMLYTTLGPDNHHTNAHHMPGPTASHTAPTPVLAITLAVLFALDALSSLAAIALLREPANPPPWFTVRIAILPHIVMDLGMSIMLLAGTS